MENQRKDAIGVCSWTTWVQLEDLINIELLKIEDKIYKWIKFFVFGLVWFGFGFGFSKQGFPVALEYVLELVLVDQAGLELTEIQLPLPPECW